LNLGGETFSPPQVIAPSACAAIAVGDLNQDGMPDLVTGGGPNQGIGVTVLLAESDGGFSDTKYSTLYGDYTSYVLEDLNGDGLPDIAAATDPGFYVLLNQGGGRFGAPTHYSNSYCSRYLVVADFNGDCWPDVLATTGDDCRTWGSSSLYLFLNRGDGTFSPALAIDSGLQTAGGIAAYRGAGALLPSIAVAGACSPDFEILPNLTAP
jgi:FG-GAP-like repeat